MDWPVNSTIGSVCSEWFTGVSRLYGDRNATIPLKDLAMAASKSKSKEFTQVRWLCGGRIDRFKARRKIVNLRESLVKRAISDSRSRALVQPKVTTFLESVKAHGDTRLADHDQFVSLRVFADRCTRLLKAIENAASTPDEVFQFVSAPSPHASSS
jgi:hypothetical protein